MLFHLNSLLRNTNDNIWQMHLIQGEFGEGGGYKFNSSRQLLKYGKL